MIIGAEVKDTLSGKSTQVYAKQVINATGPFTDSLRQMSDPSKPSIIMPSAGLILPAACSVLAVPMVINMIAHSAHEHHVNAVSMSQHGYTLYQCHSMASSRQSPESPYGTVLCIYMKLSDPQHALTVL